MLKRSGFTLAEVLMVVGVVGILSIMAVTSYTHYRKASLIDIAAENVISQLHELRDGVKFGEDVSEGSHCKGLMFTGLVGGQIQKFNLPYEGKKSWADGGWTSSGCGGEMQFFEFDMDDLVSVRGLYEGGREIAECGVMFAPPDGNLVTMGCDGASELEVLLQYGEAEKHARLIKIDLITGVANVDKNIK
ncbi:prepilin-type N-terminal cleavage/methylation domain-containing protein [Candidatus Peregrinibacteria bacterium]|jgi:prepilin-type N-terminal cleavage/methylation domain-containing protein|nr:prepilin-type N-terminal cleavage/methylation domain-containing protein [Candidatus Peregrinibacteria bacterium]MBT4148419.1 prepilin-type N-terminal cleavage/methylation domain-containing protein [Candidatus Peregrinibacteria bacterium]MBT4366478.1 prepilin-type N-terminal cleavage/methylation domain-containing protein [Candidatus Peregrinibacteria bacterium]MBT4456071.1 prepilin-type N-terminal cleavage/methylation domain-containing protein [Candidatus Peregrinibacteria bacterium]